MNFSFFFFNDTATTEIYTRKDTLSLHDALPICGLVTIHSQTKEITRSGQYWAFAHFSRVIRRGAHRFDSQGVGADVDHVACENSDGERVLVVTNPSTEKQVVLQLGAMVAELTLSSNSVTTLAWT